MHRRITLSQLKKLVFRKLWLSQRLVPLLWLVPQKRLLFLYANVAGIRLLRSWSYESTIVKWCQENIAIEDTCIDIGANEGFYSLILSSLVGKKGHIIAFEPEELSRARLKRNLRLNFIKNTLVRHEALGDVNEVKGLLCPKGYESRSSLIGLPSDELPFSPSTKARNVEVTTLDYWLQERDIGPISLIKIDVEGYESRVLEGAEETIKRYSPAIIIEIEEIRGETPLYNKLARLNYKIIASHSVKPGRNTVVVTRGES